MPNYLNKPLLVFNLYSRIDGAESIAIAVEIRFDWRTSNLNTERCRQVPSGNTTVAYYGY